MFKITLSFLITLLFVNIACGQSFYSTPVYVYTIPAQPPVIIYTAPVYSYVPYYAPVYHSPPVIYSYPRLPHRPIYVSPHRHSGGFYLHGSGKHHGRSFGFSFGFSKRH